MKWDRSVPGLRYGKEGVQEGQLGGVDVGVGMERVSGCG